MTIHSVGLELIFTFKAMSRVQKYERYKLNSKSIAIDFYADFYMVALCLPCVCTYIIYF